MRAPDRSVHDFKCPDCGGWCQLIQEGSRASMRHAKPACKTYEATKKDGQKFLELAFIAYPEKPERVQVAFGGRTERAEPPAANDLQPNVANDPPTFEPTEELPPPPVPAAVRARYMACTCLVGEDILDQRKHARSCPWSADWPQPTPRGLEPMPPRWQPLLDALSSELRALVHERGQHSAGLARAIANAKPGDVLEGFDDGKIAGIGQAIAAICAAAKGHP